MTSLQHHSHHVNHHNTPSSSSNPTNIVSNTPLNNSTSNLSPVIQRKIDSQQLFLTNNNNNLQPPLFNQRHSSGSVGAGGAGAVGGIDFDTTSIASVSESSHWSGGGGDDLDNIALVNGSDTNTMENKAWSDFINSKNGYNSSEDDNEYDEDGINNDDSISTSSSTRTKLKTIDDSNSFKKSKKTSSANLITNNNIRKKSNDIIIKSKKVNKENEIDTTSNEQQTNNNKTKNKRHNSLINNTNNNNSISIATSNDEITDKKLPKKVSQDSLKSSAHIINNESSKLQDENKNLEDEDQLSTSTKHQNQDIQDDNEFIDDDDEEEDDEEEDNEYNDFDEDDDEDNDDDEDEDDDDDLDDDDIWTIKPKLYSYYEKQFKIMQPNLNGFITGSVAKPFFERSRLPLNELSKIWELSDVTRDGALSFAEFCTAMHLVVLRVRNYDLPSELPAKLQPYAPLIDFNSETMGENANKINDESMHNLSDNEDLTLSSPTQSSTRFFNTGQKNNSDKPLVFSIKPQIPSDVQIVHPVALRYNNVSNISNQHYQQQQQILTNYQQTNSNEIYSKTNDATLNSTSISPASSNLIPEPPPRHSRSSSLVNINTPTVINTLSTMSNQAVIMTPKILQQQPVVPPRITSPPPAFQQQQQQQIYYHNQENESSNLNATIMQQQHAAALASNALLPPPPPPPPLPHHHNLHHYQQQTRLQQQQQQNLIHNPISAVVSPTQFSIRAPPPIPGSFVNQTITINQNVIPSSSNPDDINKTIEKLIEQLNVFNLEKLKKSSESKQQQQQQIGTSSSTSSTNSIERDVLTSSIRTQTEQNQLLKRLFNELEKELRSLTDTRIALEIKLDFLNTATVNSNVVNNNNNISISGSSVTTTNTNSNVNTNQSIVTSISQQQVNNITQTPTTKQSIQKILPNTPASTVSIATSNSNMTPSYSSTTNSLSSSSNNNNNNNNSSLTTPVTTVNNTLIANPSNKI